MERKEAIMGQYHFLVNLDKREFINPHKLAVGLKACEQLASPVSTPQALFILLVCSNGRGGGDLAETRGFNERIIGRWAGDRIAVVGDYAEDYDIKAPLHDPVSAIYDLCYEGVYREISALVRPVLEAELGVAFSCEPRMIRYEDGRDLPYEDWSVRRDENAEFSVLDG
jgi:hypothetical protein